MMYFNIFFEIQFFWSCKPPLWTDRSLFENLPKSIKNHEKSWKIMKILILDFFSKSSFRNIRLIDFFFWKEFFVVKISTTNKFFQKKNRTSQNIMKTDFHEFSIIMIISKIIAPEGWISIFSMISKKSGKSVFWIFWGIEFFFWKNLFVVEISSRNKFYQRKKSTPQNIRKPDFAVF